MVSELYARMRSNVFGKAHLQCWKAEVLLQALTLSFLVVQSVSTFIITARECTRALNAARMEQHGSLKTWLVCTADTFGVEFRIAALKFLAWWSSMRITLKLDRKPKGQLAPPTPLQGAPAA